MREAQAVIIGGGAMGVSLLYHLTAAGWRDVALYEKNDLTHGSTWHAAGLCTHFAHNATIQALRARSVGLYRDILPEETGLATGFHPTGAMRITRSAERMAEFAHVVGLAKFTGHPLRLITPEEIAELHPLATLDGLIGGIHEPTDGHVDPSLAVAAMAAAARARGGEIRRFDPVHAIRRETGGWRVEAESGAIRARHVVNAAGTWGHEVGRMMGLDIPSTPILHQYLVTDRIEAVAARDAELPIIRDPEESWYVRQERDGLILGPYETDAAVWSPDRVPPDFGADLLPPDLDRVEHIVEAAMRRIPALADAGVKTVVNGPITFSPDANPLIGPLHGVPGAWAMTGSSMGVMEGGGAGWFLAEWMTKGAPPMDALAVDPRRFGAWADRDYRIAKAVECFGLQFGVHYPHEERPAARGRRLTPLHGRMAAEGAVFGAAHGWERPNYFGEEAAPTFARPDWFGAVAAEVANVAANVSLADLSIFSTFRLEGADAGACLARLGANRPPPPGRVGLIHALTPAGGVAAEFTVARVSADVAWHFSAAAAEEIDADLLRAHAEKFDVTLTNATAVRGGVGVMGPKARELLARVTRADLSNEAFPWLAAREIDVAGRAALALRVSYVGELGWELHADAGDVAAIFDALINAGGDLGVGLFGAYAMNAMRLEKGFPAWGADLTSERTPEEAGLARVVHTDGRTFTGRDAMIARRGEGWRLALLALDGGGPDPFYGHPVLADGAPVGVVTSGAWGHRVGTGLAMAYLRPDAGAGPFEVEILGATRPARLLDNPPYDPQHLRMKA